MIEIKNLAFSYPNTKIKVFDGFNLNLQKGGIYGLLGKNGTGKSTLIYLIAGLLRPVSGEVLVDGVKSLKRVPSLLSELYVVPEDYNLPDLTLKQYLEMHVAFYPRFSVEILERCLKEFELSLDMAFKTLSMGQKKKIYMSFALASQCKFLLMDEPTNGLDIPSKSLFRKVVAGNVSEDSVVIISTHQVHDVEQLLDHVLILDHSNLLVDASVETLAEKYVCQMRASGDLTPDIIYAEPSLQGNMVLAHRNPTDKETPINLELFFNAATMGKL